MSESTLKSLLWLLLLGFLFYWMMRRGGCGAVAHRHGHGGRRRDAEGPPPNRVTDPVCGMEVDPAQAAASREARGWVFHFCSDACAARFDADPSAYIQRAEPRGPSHPHGP